MLVRSAHHSDLLEIELAARGIPYVKYGGLRFTEAAHVKDFIAAARVVANPADDLAWFRLLRLHEGVGPVLARRVIEALADRLSRSRSPAGPRPRLILPAAVRRSRRGNCQAAHAGSAAGADSGPGGVGPGRAA